MFIRLTDEWVREAEFPEGVRPTRMMRMWARAAGWRWSQRAVRDGRLIVELRRSERRSDSKKLHGPLLPVPLRRYAI